MCHQPLLISLTCVVVTTGSSHDTTAQLRPGWLSLLHLPPQRWPAATSRYRNNRNPQSWPHKCLERFGLCTFRAVWQPLENLVFVDLKQFNFWPCCSDAQVYPRTTWHHYDVVIGATGHTSDHTRPHPSGMLDVVGDETGLKRSTRDFRHIDFQSGVNLILKICFFYV